MSARTQLAESLAELLPAGWRLIPYQDSVDELDTVVVMLKHSTLAKLPTAPLGAYLSTFTVTIVDPHTDAELAEDALDDGVLELLAALDQINSSLWSTAEKTLFQDRYLSWDVPVQVVTNITQKETEHA